MVCLVAGISFDVPIEIVVLGVISGLGYGLLAAGFTLVYRSTRVLNFAHGELSAFAGLLMPVLVLSAGWGYWPALLVALAAGAGGGAAVEVVVVRRLARAPRLVLMVATIGVAQLFLAGQLMLPKTGGLFGSGDYPVPFEANVTIGDLHLNAGHLMILVVAPVVMAALALFLRHTRIGLAARASAENNDAAVLAGVPVARVSLVVWTVSGLLAASSAVLLGPTVPLLSPTVLGAAFLLRGLAAAMLGGLDRLPVAFAGGIAIGVIEMVVSWNYPTGGFLELVLLVVVLVTLVLQRQLGAVGRGGERSSWSLTGRLRSLDPATAASPPVARLRKRFLFGAGFVAALAAVPMGSGHRILLSSIVLFALIGLSLVVLTGLAGQVSLGQFAFVAIGAATAGRAHQLGFPPWMQALLATVAGGLAAGIVGLPALRVRGLFLGVATLGFAVVTSTWVLRQGWLVHRDDTGTSLLLPRPRWLGIDFQNELDYYWLCLLALAGVALLVDQLRRSGVGRAMIAVRDNEPSAAAMGISPRRIKLLAFTLSGAIAGFGGFLYGGLLVNFGDLLGTSDYFGPARSLELVTMTVFGGITSITGVVAGALWVRGIPYFFGTNIGLVTSGIGVLVALLFLPGGLASALMRIRDRIVAHVLPDVVEEPGAGTPAPAPAPATRPFPSRPASSGSGDVLVAEGISVRFGGRCALDGVDLRVGRGEIVGVLGPNGAGKTTLFDVLSGHVRPDAGRVVLNGWDVTGLPPERIAGLGLARTFQEARLFDEMSLLDVTKTALEGVSPSELVPSLLGMVAWERDEMRRDARAWEVLERMGLDGSAHQPVSALSTGMRRIAELACVAAAGAPVVLLDEPTAGIAQREVEAFAPLLRRVRDELDASMVLVAHEVPLVRSLADRLYVLDAGRVIADGPPAAVLEDPAVVHAYLGADDRWVERSSEGGRTADLLASHATVKGATR